MDADKRVSASGMDMGSGYASMPGAAETAPWARTAVGKPAHPLDALNGAEIHAAAAACRAYVASSKPLLRFNAITLQVRYCNATQARVASGF